MALTLDAGLASAQSSQSRRPIIELISGQRVADIPFDGTFLTDSADQETQPFTITLSDGRICVAYHYWVGAGDRGLKFYITNTERNYFETTFTINTTTDISGAAIVQLADGNIGIIYVEDTGSKLLKYRIVTTAGAAVSDGTIETFAAAVNFSHTWVVKTATDYLMVYVHDLIYVTPSSGGTYTDTSDSIFTIEVTTSGTETTGYFKWRKDDGAWSSPILMTGAAQSLSDGVTITFAAGNYYIGQIYYITCIAAVKAQGKIVVNSVPDDSDTMTVGATTYTFVDELIDSYNPNEVVIDPWSREISLQNFLCALTDTSFEGTGEGDRYGNGTVANASATGTRSDRELTLEALTAGAAGNSITLTVDTDHFSKVDFAGGSDSSISAVTGGNSYAMYKRTSSNFTSWTAESAIDLGSLLPSRLKDTPSLVKLDNDDVMLFFAYADDVNDNLDSLTNIYFMTSDDDGATWDTPDDITTSVSFSETSDHPMAVLRDTGALYVMYTRNISALRMDKSAFGWPSGSYSDFTFELCFDSANRKLYITNKPEIVATKDVQNVVKLDVDTWTVDQYWDRTSTLPRFGETVGTGASRYIGDGYLIPVYDNNDIVELLNGESDTITRYCFNDNATYGYVKNLDWTQYGFANSIRTAQVDAASNRIYIFRLGQAGGNTDLQIGYIDISSSTFTVIVEEHNTVTVGWNFECEMRVYPSIDRIFISGVNASFQGGLRIYDLIGQVIDDYRYGNDPQFPYWGMRNLCYHNGFLFGSFIYESGFSQSSRRGLVKIDLSTRNCTYHRPSWTDVDNYLIQSIEPSESTELVVTCFSLGVTIYDISGDGWTLYNNTTIPEMIPDAGYSFRCSAYDAANEYVFVGYHSAFETYRGISMFSTVGQIIQSYYQVGTYPVDTWVWQTEAVLVQGFGDYDTVGTIDADDTMYCFWQSNDREPTSPYAIKWDQDGSGVNLAQYLMIDREVVMKKTIDGSPNTLEFSCSHGHLFDPFNQLSLLSNTFKKGRKITLRWGETISGVPTWQNGGEFYVKEGKTSYKRGTYSRFDVRCEDDRTFWTDKKILVSTSYNDTPQNIITDMLTSYAGIDAGDIDMPTMSESNLKHQFIDVTLEDAINKVCNRFGYFFTINVDGEYTARLIDDGNATDHTYYNLDTVDTFTPDNTYSNNVNRIRVIGNELTANVLSTEEEVLANLDGTVGWWGGTKVHQVYYSEDRKRRAQNVRLHVIETVTAIGFALAGEITEELTYEDPTGHYCEVTITAPNLTWLLILALAALIGSFFVADFVIFFFTIRIGTYLSAFACWLALNVLGGTGSYFYEIYGFPFGDVTYSVDATANDTAHQTEVGYVIEQEINDDLCYNTADCQFVADYELMIIMLQRNNLDIKKITHLQDEEGDTIIFPHPYSGNNLKMYVTELTRRFKKSNKAGDEGGGYFYDDFTGWIIL